MRCGGSPVLEQMGCHSKLPFKCFLISLGDEGENRGVVIFILIYGTVFT